MPITIAVCLKRVHDISVPVRLDAARRAIRSEDAGHAANRADLSALALALRLKAEWKDARVLALTVGPPEWDEPLRQALAQGAGEALRVWNPEWPPERWNGQVDGSAGHTQFVAAAAANALAQAHPALVLTGEASSDTAHGCFGAFLAHALGAAFANRAVALERRERDWLTHVKLERGYTQALPIEGVAVVTISAALPAPAEPALPAWMASRTAAIPGATFARAYPEVTSSELCAPVPRVKRYTIPDAGLNAEARIRALVDLPIAGGGTRVAAEEGIEAQLLAIEQLLRERGYSGG